MHGAAKVLLVVWFVAHLTSKKNEGLNRTVVEARNFAYYLLHFGEEL
jgi:hypothetical protein